MRPALTIEDLLKEANAFAVLESSYSEPKLYGITDGKAVGTYVEHKFKNLLAAKYNFVASSSASWIDFPEIGVDIKVTSIIQPQSSCPYKSARQKIFGLGYSLLIFVYSKSDDAKTQTSTLNILHTIFVEKEHTADYQMTKHLNSILANNGNADDLVAYMQDKYLPVDDDEARSIAEELLQGGKLKEGFIMPSMILKFQSPYSLVISEAGNIDGIIRVR
jgi:hypothetical protein